MRLQSIYETLDKSKLMELIRAGKHAEALEMATQLGIPIDPLKDLMRKQLRTKPKFPGAKEMPYVPPGIY